MAQQRECVVAGVMAVAPGRRDGVITDELEIHHPGLLRRERRSAVEPAGEPRLATAVCAWTEPTERGQLVAGGVAIRPFDIERASLAIGVDRPWSGFDGHRPIVAHRRGIGPRACGVGREHPGPSTQRRIRAGGAILRRVTLDIDHVTKRFAATLALDDLAFSVPRGRIFGFLGANGAGKTTTMRICLGILQADSGEVRWDGTPTTALPRRTWGYLPEERGLYPRMGVLDQLVYFATLYGQPADVARREARHWLARFRIPEYAERRAEELSKGNQQKVQFIAAILHGPEVLLMDEPFTGLDPVNLALLREAFVEQRDAGRTIVFSTHQMEAAEALCESLAIVDQGRVVAGGTLAELKRTSRSRTVRLGIEGETMPVWLGAVPGVIAVRPGAGFAEVELAAGTEPSAVLAAAVARGADVTRFEVAEPSLEAIFIEKVGRSAEDEATLADDASTQDTTGVPESIVEGAA
jgi:ABC-2 type transport system ATP-binding protein